MKPANLQPGTHRRPLACAVGGWAPGNYSRFFSAIIWFGQVLNTHSTNELDSLYLNKIQIDNTALVLLKAPKDTLMQTETARKIRKRVRARIPKSG